METTTTSLKSTTTTDSFYVDVRNQKPEQRQQGRTRTPSRHRNLRQNPHLRDGVKAKEKAKRAATTTISTTSFARATRRTIGARRKVTITAANTGRNTRQSGRDELHRHRGGKTRVGLAAAKITASHHRSQRQRQSPVHRDQRAQWARRHQAPLPVRCLRRHQRKRRNRSRCRNQLQRLSHLRHRSRRHLRQRSRLHSSRSSRTFSDRRQDEHPQKMRRQRECSAKNTSEARQHFRTSTR